MNGKRRVYFISDGTGITAESLGTSLMTQFDGIEYEAVTMPYLEDLTKAQELSDRIKAEYQNEQLRPIIFATLVDPEIRQTIIASGGLFIDFFTTFISTLETEFRAHSGSAVGRTHSVTNERGYQKRIDAVNFSLTTDDGVNTHQYDPAEIILIGVSRSGKTPTCLYLALHYGIYAANYPVTEDDLSRGALPDFILKHKHKIFGLLIDPMRLHAIRSERRPHSQYASIPQCKRELKFLENVFQRLKIPHLNTTTLSIEEIATKILMQMGIERRPR